MIVFHNFGDFTTSQEYVTAFKTWLGNSRKLAMQEGNDLKTLEELART